jgi:hypothetical protein
MSSPVVVDVELPASRPPWTPTGVRVEPGDQVTLLGSGRVGWIPGRDIGAGAKYHLWGRVPGGVVFNGTADTTTVTVDHPGELELCVYIGRWADRSGTLATGTDRYAKLTGGLRVRVIRWTGDPLDGLEAMADGDERAAAELARLRHPVTRPPGWSHLLDFGDTDIFRAATTEDGRPAIDVVCDDDAGILQRAVAVPLDPSSTIEWSWRVDELPSSTAENASLAHDYLSIATEFDSGRDLTWFWSATLDPEATFDCPIRGWGWRETHCPVRSGRAGLGRWQHERRSVHADHERWMGSAPASIVKVWLIAVSHFQRGRGRATFADIRLTTNGTVHRVL